MASVNKVILIGNLGRDPETCYTAEGGLAICSITVATSRRYKDAQGALQEETEWHRVVLFGRQAEVAQTYLKKGNPVYIEGRLRTRKYTDKQGVERFSTEIVAESLQFLGARNAATPPSHTASQPHAAPAAQSAQLAASAQSLSEDDVPF